MATIWNKVFNRINWQNKPSTASPLNSTNLNAGDYALNVIDERVVELNNRINGFEPQLANLGEQVELAHKWAQWTDGTNPTATNNAKYWAQVAQSAADSAIIDLGSAGYIGFMINEYGHLILTKSTNLTYLDFNLDPTHKDLIVTVTETTGS